MLREVSRARRRVTFAAGVAGVVGAHLLAYALAYSNPSVRAQALRDTGHGYFPAALWLAAGAAALSLAAAAARGAALTVRHGRGRSAVPGIGALAGWQAVLFLLVESGERVLSGTPLGEMARGREVMIGLAVQVVVATVIVLLLGATERVAARIATARRRPARPGGGRTGLRPGATTYGGRLAGDATRSRSPPRPAARLVPARR